MAAVENGKGRNRSDLEALGQLGVRIGIDLEDQRAAGEVLRRLLHLRRDHAAWSAPRRPEVDHDRDGRVGDRGIERRGVCHIDRVGIMRQRGATFPASRFAFQARESQPIHRAARRTGHQDALGIELHLRIQGATAVPAVL
jgi:hypothetical protein